MDAGICHIRAAVNVRMPLAACFWATFFLSLLALIAAFLLALWAKSGSELFLGTSGFLAVLASVVGTTGKVSLQGVTNLIRTVRRN
jgi:hypothetical protein